MEMPTMMSQPKLRSRMDENLQNYTCTFCLFVLWKLMFSYVHKNLL